MKKEIIAFVHAKRESTRILSKNMKMLGDKPLFCHAVTHAKQSRLISKVVIDSDGDEILKMGESYGAIPLKRPAELATNKATGDDLAFWQASNYPDSDIVLQVIPTAPFLQSESIDAAIQLLINHPDVDSVAGVYEEALYCWKEGKPCYYNKDGTIPNSFEMKKIMYETTGLYINYTRSVLRTKRRLNPDKCMPYLLSKIESIDINTLDDFSFAEIVWSGLYGKNKNFGLHT